LLGQIPSEKVQEKVSSPASLTNLLVPLYRPPLHQYNPCRGSSIGRACGSYYSKEINLKVVGSSPTFGYSYITSSSEQLFFCFLVARPFWVPTKGCEGGWGKEMVVASLCGFLFGTRCYLTSVHSHAISINTIHT
jgi:hypothetical protein